jgi:prepilin peptidase CpaA
VTPVTGGFAEILWLSGYGGLLATAVLTDLRALRIPNMIPLLLVGLFVVVAGVTEWAARPVNWPSHLLAGGIVFGAGLGLFAWGKIGGGDVKLLTAVALWHGLHLLPELLLLTALLGGVLGLAFLVLRKSGLATMLAASGVRSVVLEDGAGIPYAVAIVAACGVMLTQHQLPFLSN